MASRISLERLPMELFLAVVAHLDIRDQAALGQCRRAYHGIIERDMFRLETMRDFAMRHAIRNIHIHLIRRLLTQHRASPTVMYVLFQPEHPPDPMEDYRGNVALTTANYGSSILGHCRKLCEFYPEDGDQHIEFGIAELTLHELAMVDTSTMDAAQRKTYLDIWTLFLECGARFNVTCCAQTLRNHELYEHEIGAPTVPPQRYAVTAVDAHYALEHGRQKARALFRRIMRKPSWNRQLAAFKADLIRIYYRALRPIAVADLDIGTSSIFQEIPRHIRCEHDTVVVEALLDGEEQIERDERDKRDKRTHEADDRPPNWGHIRAVDRPVQRGQRGELVSPLSAAVLNQNMPVFELLLRRGANINGVDLSFKRHSPTKYALHIPMFAAAWLTARDFEQGTRWIAVCTRHGANTRHLCLGRLNGDYFIQSGTDGPEHQGFFYWMSPLDVYLSTIPKHVLGQKIPAKGNADTFHPAETTQCARLSELVGRGMGVDLGVGQPLAHLIAPQYMNGHMPAAAEHMCGTAKMFSGQPCNWGGFHRCRSPSSAEIVIDRLGFRHVPCTAAYGLVKDLMARYGSGIDCFSRLLLRYEADMRCLVSDESPTIAPDPMITLIFSGICSPRWARSNIESQLGVYIIQRMLQGRYGAMRAHLATIEHFKHAITVRPETGGLYNKHGVVLYAQLDLHIVYWPANVPGNLAFDDYRLRACGHAPDRFNACPLVGWTALHEICRLWNASAKERAASTDDCAWTEFCRDNLEMTKLFYCLIENSADIYDRDRNGETPLDMLVKDEEHVLPHYYSTALKRMADYMMATSECFGVEMETG